MRLDKTGGDRPENSKHKAIRRMNSADRFYF
jgi:hypothetical protein